MTDAAFKRAGGGRNTSTNKRQQQHVTADTAHPQQQQQPHLQNQQTSTSTIPTTQSPIKNNNKDAAAASAAAAVKRQAILGDEQLRIYMRNLKSELNFATARTSMESISTANDDEQRRDLDAARQVNADTMQQLQQLEDMYESEHSIILASLNRILAQLNYPHSLRSIGELVERQADIQNSLKSELEIEIMQHKPPTTISVDDEQDNKNESDEEVQDEAPVVEPIPNFPTNYEELCESAVKISHDNFSTVSIPSRKNSNSNVMQSNNAAQQPRRAVAAAQMLDNSTMTPAAPATTPEAPARPSSAGNSFTVDIKDPKTGKRVHSFQSPAPLSAGVGGGGGNLAAEDDVNMTAFTTAAALAGFKEMVKVDVFVRPDMILASDPAGDAEGGGAAGKVTIELNSRELCGV